MTIGPEHLLAESESATRVNEHFYAAEPAEYFWWRLYLLALAGDTSIDLIEHLRRGVKVDGFEFGPVPDAVEGEEEAKLRRSFVVADSAALLHHLSETLLRLFLAHDQRPLCPWLEIARVRSPEAFKDRVRSFFNDTSPEQRRASIGRVFYGSSDRTAITPRPSLGEFEAGLANIEEWLKHFAAEFLDHASHYNAVKHGFAVVSGDAAMKVADGSILSADGPAIAFLETREDSSRRRWTISTRWQQVDQTLARCIFGVYLIDSLWNVARMYYRGEKPARIRFLAKPRYDDFIRATSKAGDTGVVITKMSWDLLYRENEGAGPAGE